MNKYLVVSDKIPSTSISYTKYKGLCVFHVQKLSDMSRVVLYLRLVPSFLRYPLLPSLECRYDLQSYEMLDLHAILTPNVKRSNWYPSKHATITSIPRGTIKHPDTASKRNPFLTHPWFQYSFKTRTCFVSPPFPARSAVIATASWKIQ